MATEKNQLETYFEWYINELKEAGFIKLVKREPFPILVSDIVERKRYDFSTKTPRIENYKLFQKNTYMCDWIIIWEKHAHEIFYNLIDDNPLRIYCPFYAIIDNQGEHISFVDVKPPAGAMIFGNNTSGYTFPILQKMIYTIYGIYVNKSIPIPLMAQVFQTVFKRKRIDGSVIGDVCGTISHIFMEKYRIFFFCCQNDVPHFNDNAENSVGIIYTKPKSSICLE